MPIPVLTPVSLTPDLSPPSILIVDDEPDSVRALSQILKQAGYTVRCTLDSQLALKSVELELPDLIVLDVMMPGITGFELCRQLKQAPHSRAIPIIFITALDDITDKLNAFAVGGADYLVKPFQAEEVLVRIRHQLTLTAQQKQLQRQNQQLLAEIEQRQQAEKKYRDIFENVTEGIFQTTLDGQYLSANPALARLYGYDTATELIRSIEDIGRQVYVQPKRRSELEIYLKRYGSVQNAESEIYRRDGSTLWVSENIRLVRDAAGNPRYYEGTVQDVTARRKAEWEVQQQRKRAERLLYNILPFQIAQKLQKTPAALAEQFDQVTVLFADIVDFTPLSQILPPRDLVDLLNQIFSTFDQLVESAGLEKIKTIGDAYMVAAGLPTPRTDHAVAIAHLALAMQAAIGHFTVAEKPLQIRIGINSGPVVAGVIGRKKFAYDLWGDTVNLASRLQATSLPGYIQVSPITYQALQSHFQLTPRGEIAVKGLGNLPTYWLNGPL